MYTGRRGRVNKRVLRGILGKPIHRLSEGEVDLVLDGIVNARPLKPRRPGAGELYRKATALGADPCDLVEARGVPECGGRPGAMPEPSSKQASRRDPLRLAVECAEASRVLYYYSRGYGVVETAKAVYGDGRKRGRVWRILKKHREGRLPCTAPHFTPHTGDGLTHLRARDGEAPGSRGEPEDGGNAPGDVATAGSRPAPPAWLRAPAGPHSEARPRRTCNIDHGGWEAVSHALDDCEVH